MLSEKQKLALWHLEKNPEITELLYGGSAGGGKSWVGSFWQISRRIAYPGTRGALCRSELKALKATTYRTFKKVWKAYFLDNPYGVTWKLNNQDNVIYWSNGSETFLLDLFQKPSDEDFHSLGSLELTDAFIDEAGEIKRKARDILQSRIRHDLINGKPALLMGCNPAQNFLKFEYVSDKNNNPVQPKDYQKFISAKLDDNPDKEFVAAYKMQLEKLPLYDRLRLLMGDWSVNENEHPFFYEYNSDKHIKECEIEDFETLWLSFDFNIDPTTVVLGAKIPGKGLFIYDCIQVKGGTEKLCGTIEWVKEHPAGISVTGDRSGNSGSSVGGVVEDGSYNTDFGIIKEVLELNSFDLMHTKKRNANHEYSRKVCNRVFTALPIYISPKAQALITDLQIAQATDQGKLKKDRENFKMDACDAFRYLINAWFPAGFSDIQEFKNTL